jgi:PAS domain S-box-containing protein
VPKRDRIDWLLTAINAVEDLVQPKLLARRGLHANAAQRERDEELEVCMEELRVAAEELEGLRDRLLAERQRYAELFDFAPDPYLEIDARWNLREANRAAVALLNCEHDRLVGKPLAVFVPADVRKDLRSRLFELTQRDRGGVVEFETQVQPRDEPPVAVRIRASAARDASGRVQSVRCLIRAREPAPAERVHADDAGESG